MGGGGEGKEDICRDAVIAGISCSGICSEADTNKKHDTIDRPLFLFGGGHSVVFLSLLVEMDCAGFLWFGGIRESQIGLPLQVKFQCLPTTAAEHGRIQRDRAN